MATIISDEATHDDIPYVHPRVGDIHPMLRILKMFMSISSMKMEECYTVVLFWQYCMAFMAPLGGWCLGCCEIVDSRFVVARDPHRRMGFRCVLDASELRRREPLQRAGGLGFVFFLGVLGSVMGDHSIVSMRMRRHDALEKAGVRKWHALCLLLQRSMTELVARSHSAHHETLAIRWADPKTSLRASQFPTLTPTRALGSYNWEHRWPGLDNRCWWRLLEMARGDPTRRGRGWGFESG